MFEDFFKPISFQEIVAGDLPDSCMGKHLRVYDQSFPDLTGIDLAIIGVKEERGAVNNEGCNLGADEIRKAFYALYKTEKTPRIADLGNIEAGASLNDTYVALSTVVNELIKMSIVPVIIGGSHDLTFAQYAAYEGINKNTTLAVIDERIDLKEIEPGEEPQELKFDADSFLMKILSHTPNFLFNISQVGYQSYFVEPRAIDVFEKMHFDCIRLGRAREQLPELEPVLRDADLVSIDISAIRQSDAPANQHASPNGFYGEEMCQLARYAGMSDKLTSIGFYEFNPEFDNNRQTAQLVAQMIWYFMDGFYSRKKDNPAITDKEYVKYIVHDKDNGYELIFWKSNKSDRWWVQVPARSNKKNEKTFFISCSYSDYQIACREEVPERWMRAYERLS